MVYFFTVIFIIFYSSSETIIAQDRYSFKASLIPFKEIKLMLSDNFAIGILTIFSNILLFLPFGIFIPLLTSKPKHVINILITVFFVSLTIEINQVILSNTGNIDNIIFSLIGSLIGFYFFKLSNSNFIPLFKDTTSVFLRITSITCSFFLIYQVGLHINDYNIIKNKIIPSSAIPTMLDEYNLEIIASLEDEFSKTYMSKDSSDNLYVRKFIKKLDKFLDLGNIKISSSDTKYYIDNKQNIVYFEELNSATNKVTTLRLFLKSNNYSSLSLLYMNKEIKTEIKNGYSIIDIDVSSLNIPTLDDSKIHFMFK